MPDYQNLTDDEVLQLASESEQLTEDARTVLDSELTRRKLSIRDIRSHKIAYEHAQTIEKARRQQRMLSRGSYDRYGIGFGFRGKTKLRRDLSGQSEEYNSTRWFTVFWIPVFPVATFIVRRTISRWMGIPYRSEPQIISRHPRDWEQILLTSVKTAAFLLALRLGWLYLIHHADFLRKVLS